MRPLTEKSESDDFFDFFGRTIGERYPSVFLLARVNIPLTFDSSGNARRRSFITR